MNDKMRQCLASLDCQGFVVVVNVFLTDLWVSARNFLLCIYRKKVMFTATLNDRVILYFFLKSSLFLFLSILCAGGGHLIFRFSLKAFWSQEESHWYIYIFLYSQIFNCKETTHVSFKKVTHEYMNLCLVVWILIWIYGYQYFTMLKH